MNFLLVSLCFLTVAAGLPFPQEFLTPPSQAPPVTYQHDSPVSENHRGFRVQQIVPDGNTVTKVVIQVPNEPHQRIHEGFQRTQIVQHYYPENQQSSQVIQYQDVPQRIEYVPQGVPENMPHLFVPAQQVAQAVEQIPQGIHHSVQNVEQVPQRSKQSMQQVADVQHSFIQQKVQVSHEVNQRTTAIPEGVQGAQQTPSTDGQSAINERQPVQPVVQSVAAHQIPKEEGVIHESQEIYHKSTQAVPQSVQLEAQLVQNIPQDYSLGGLKRSQSWQTSQKEQFSRDQKVDNAPQDTHKPQRTPEVQKSPEHKQNRPDQSVVTVQHGPYGVHVIRQEEHSAQQQHFAQKKLVQSANEQSQDTNKNENTVPLTTAPQISQQQTSDAQREQVRHPVVHVVQLGTQGVQTIREGEYDKKHAGQQGTNIQPSQNNQKASNTFTVQQVSEVPNTEIDQRESNVVNHQPVLTVQHGSTGVHIVRQEEFVTQHPKQHQQLHQQPQQQVQQEFQHNIHPPQTSENELNAVPTAQTISHGVQGFSNKATPTIQSIIPAIFKSDLQNQYSEVQRIPQAHVSHEADRANAVAQNAAPVPQSITAQVQSSIQQSTKPSHQSPQGTHFSFGFQDHSSVVKQDIQKTEATPVSHFSFGTQGHTSVVKQEPQQVEATPQPIQNQATQTKPQGSAIVSDNVQHLPPSLHTVAQNVVAEVPQVSQSIKEANLGVQAIPVAVQQASQGVHQLNQGIHQAFENIQQVNPVSNEVRNIYQGIRNSVHPTTLSSAEAYVNSIHRDKQPIQSQQLQQVLNQIQQVRHEVRQKQESQRPQEALSQQEGLLDQENRQIPFQEEDIRQQNQKQFQSGFQPLQNQGQRGQPSRLQYGNRKPVQSAPVNQIYDNTPNRVESPVDDEAEPTPIPIIRYENSVGPDGTYQWSYEAGNGIKAQESGLLRNRGETDKESIAVQGGYSYTGPDGIFYSVEYIADENGFQPLGRHLPTQPPIPEALQKAIDDHMAILATAEPDTDEQPDDEPIQTDNNKLNASQNKYNYSQRVS